jgi:tRNA modification GTPase
MDNETIVAIATPPGRGGVGIIRLSGPKAYIIALAITGHERLIPRQAIYSSFFSREKTLIDNGLTLYFKAPHSFTGEDVIEFQAHGAPLVLDCMVKECIYHSARIAKPGEFSERAFLNNKIDLTQAEAIADLINASSLTAARMAVRSLQGGFSEKITGLTDKLLQLRLYVEAAIDFPEEDLDFLGNGNVAIKLTELLQQLADIRSSANQGTLLQEGISIVIAGRPNVGKSTLINQLANRDVAIVTPIAGTTRDVMRERILLDELPIYLIDTAGLHDSDDIVEQEGIKRAWQEIRQADCVLRVLDVRHQQDELPLSQSIQAALSDNIPVITVFNKIDVVNLPATHNEQGIYLSAKSGFGLEFLKENIKTVVGFQPNEGQFLARRRHLNALDQAKNLLSTGLQQFITNHAGELLAEDLRLAHQSLCEITGEFSSDDLLGEIFSSFCIGK